MFDRSQLQQAWNQAHQEKPDSEQPEAGIISFAEFLRQKVPINSPILDAGCGRGRNARYLSQQGYTVYGCDLSPIAIAKARKPTKQMDVNNDFLVADLTQVPFPDEQFAAVICVHVLPYHFKADIVQCILQLQRVLRSGGWLYLDLLACDDAEYGCGKELEQHTFLDPDGVPIHFCSEQGVNDLLKGFKIEQLDQLERGTKSRMRIAWGIWATKG